MLLFHTLTVNPSPTRFWSCLFVQLVLPSSSHLSPVPVLLFSWHHSLSKFSCIAEPSPFSSQFISSDPNSQFPFLPSTPKDSSPDQYLKNLYTPLPISTLVPFSFDWARLLLVAWTSTGETQGREKLQRPPGCQVSSPCFKAWGCLNYSQKRPLGSLNLNQNYIVP